MNRIRSASMTIAIIFMAMISCTIIDSEITYTDDTPTESTGNSESTDNPGSPDNSENTENAENQEEHQNPDDDGQEKPDESDFLNKTKKLSGSLSVSVKCSAKATSSSSELFIALPFPVSNQYQEISSETTDGKFGTTGNGCRFVYWNEEYSLNEKANLTCGYTVSYETFSIRVDFTRIKDILPYDEDSDIYKKYLGNEGDYIVPDNPQIKEIASSLWEDSDDVVDYARKCYEYTASEYKYLNANTGLHALKENLENGGGDCGNLSAIYMSLLRSKNIPCRPVVCIRPDGTFHVWSEFYLESYGWIPVDVTYKNSDRRGNYFGVYPGDCIVVSNEYDVLLNMSDEEFSLPLLQTYAYWYRKMSDIKISYSIE